MYYCILYIYRYEAGNTFNTKYTFPVIPDYQIYHVHCTRTDTLFHLIVLRSGVDLFLVCLSEAQIGSYQGWEFAHLISELIGCFLSKNERMSNLLKKLSDSLIRSFLVSNLSDLLTVAPLY